jgi:hypothetical protein
MASPWLWPMASTCDCAGRPAIRQSRHRGITGTQAEGLSNSLAIWDSTRLHRVELTARPWKEVASETGKRRRAQPSSSARGKDGRLCLLAAGRSCDQPCYHQHRASYNAISQGYRGVPVASYRMALMGMAAREFGVPVQLLLAISYAQTRWERQEA